MYGGTSSSVAHAQYISCCFFFLSWICFENSSLFQFFSVCDVKCFLCLCLVCVFFSLWFCFCCFLLANLPFSLRILKTIFDESYNFSLLIWTLTKNQPQSKTSCQLHQPNNDLILNQQPNFFCRILSNLTICAFNLTVWGPSFDRQLCLSWNPLALFS